jgi:signal transduction histidine kinase
LRQEEDNSQLETLRQKIHQMEQIECKKAYFYAEIGHDLRQPLQAAKLFAALLKEENLSSKQTDLLSKLDSSINYLDF